MTKPKAAFISSTADNQIFHVFDADAVHILSEALEFPDKIILAGELEQHRSFLAQTEYLFSTWGMPTLAEDQIKEYFPRLRGVFYAAGSVQCFARPFLNLGIKVFSAWAANAVPVAEYTVAQIILAGKGFFQGLRIQSKEGREAGRAYNDSFPCNYGAKIGVLGVGMIGSLVCRMLKEYKLTVLAYDPFASDEKLSELGAARASLEEIFSECQTITCHIANLPATVGILNYDLFSRMKSNATFINTGRGAQVVEDDLIRALKEQPGRTALLDVTWPEPPVPESPLWTMENVFLTPHIAGSMGKEVTRMGDYMTEEFTRIFAGEAPRWEVTAKMLETMA